MTPRAFWAAAGLVLALASAEARADGASPAGDVQDIVFLGDDRPLFLRLQVQVDGQAFQAVWMDAIRRLHKSIDTDGDGRLSAEERTRGTLVRRLVDPPRPVRNLRPDPYASSAPAAPPAPGWMDDVVTADDLAGRLRPYFGPMQLRVAGPGVNAPELLFNLLDLDRDKTLSRAELEAAGASLRKADWDDDGTIQLAELLPSRNPYFGRVADERGASLAPDDAPFVLVAPSGSRTKLVRRLLYQYDRPRKDGKLSRAEIGLEPPGFERADRDGDGLLDLDETARFLDDPPPHLEVAVRLAGRGQVRYELVRRGPGQSPSLPGVQVRETEAGSVVLATETVQVEMGGAGRAGQPDPRQFYRNQFKRIDADNNGYLDQQETSRNAVFDSETFALMDRDKDGKLFESELIEFIDRESDAAEARTLLSVVDLGRSLFEVVDANRDRRLGEREIAGVPEKVSARDRDGNGRIGVGEVPQLYRLSVGRGQSTLLSRFGFATADVGPGVGSPPSASGAKGPSWFRKMDRNLDGDVSRREFLGAAADFDRLDADRNGLLDAEEASRAR